MSCSFQSQCVHCVRQRLIGDFEGEALHGWMEGIRESHFLFVRALAAVFGGARVCQLPTRSGRENAPEGGHWPMGKQCLLSRRGLRASRSWSNLWSRKGAGADHWFGIHHLLTQSSEELRERRGLVRADSSKKARESRSESDSSLGGKREDLDRV